MACVVTKTVTVKSQSVYPSHATPDDEMINRMLHLPSDKNKIYNKQSVQSVIQHKPENEIDNRTVYDILYQTCKETHLHPYVKQL